MSKDSIYSDIDVKKFVTYLKRIRGFKEAFWARVKNKREKDERIELKKEEIRASKFAEAIRMALEGTESRMTTPRATTQLVKSRQPPLWSGQQFDRWRIEVERWYENNKASDEEKYIDLLESLKKNEVIKEFVVKTLVEKVGTTRTVMRILEVMTEKFDKNMSEKTIDMMRKISGEGFKSDESVDKMIDRFVDMIMEMKKIKLAENLDYAMGLQFLERLEKSGRVSAVEKKILKDILEDVD